MLEERLDGPILEEDLLSMKSTVLEPVISEMKGRSIFSLFTDVPKGARSIGYDVYRSHGKAKKLTGGAVDVDFVGETVDRVTQDLVDIGIGYRIDRKDRDALAAARQLGRGPIVDIIVRRPAEARTAVNRGLEKDIWLGDPDHNITGFINVNGAPEFVAEGAFGGSSAENRLWANKTPLEIIKDIDALWEIARRDDKFSPNTVALSPGPWGRLKKPLNTDQGLNTVFDFIRTNYPELRWETIPALGADSNGLGGVDVIGLFENSQRVVELVIASDIDIDPPVRKFGGVDEFLVTMTEGGLRVYFPEAIVVKKGI